MKRNYLLAGGLVVLITVAVTLAFYSHLPETVPVHWNLHGQADRFGPRWEGLVLMPAVMAGVILLVAALPWLSPERYRVNGAGSGYLQVMLLVLMFLAYLQVTTLASAAGYHLPVARDRAGGCLDALGGPGICAAASAAQFLRRRPDSVDARRSPGVGGNTPVCGMVLCYGWRAGSRDGLHCRSLMGIRGGSWRCRTGSGVLFADVLQEARPAQCGMSVFSKPCHRKSERYPVLTSGTARIRKGELSWHYSSGWRHW